MKTSQKIYLPFKRIIALLGSFLGIIFCSVLLWWWIIPINAIVTKGHPFFISKRVGQNSKSFNLIKFRSMKFGTNPNMSSLSNNVEANITGFGKFLRASSLDETPQLFNIFIGQMTFIGPRPLIENEIDCITIQMRKENNSISLKPGLSGYAQIHLRGDLDPAHKAMYDGMYYENFSFLMDIKIFVYTFFKLLGAAKGR